MPTALITGIAGQDGIYLARWLRARGHHVVGTTRTGHAGDRQVYLGDGIDVVRHDLRDGPGFGDLLRKHRPDEVYNLAGFTSVGASWGRADLVHEVNVRAVESLVEQLLAHRDATGQEVRLFQASSAEETAPGEASPYARSKSGAREAVTVAREQHGLFACAGVLHNHESPLRGDRFVTRKITTAAAEIALGRRESLDLGNLTISRDWGAAADHVRAMHAMLQLDAPRDLTIATGTVHSLTQLLDTAFATVGLSDALSYVRQDPALMRPADAPRPPADISPTRATLGWEPEIGFEELIGQMVDVDRRRLVTSIPESPSYLSEPR